jgi:two-component system alkaline phosphatase synthesis response regulator PhoP
MIAANVVHSPRILIVDDEPAIADVLREYLQTENFTCHSVSDGEEALAAMQSFTPDLILLDLNLPRVSGKEVLRELRTYSNVPIIILTSRGAEIDRIIGLEIGADDYISKPFSPREVVARVRTVLRRTLTAAQPRVTVQRQRQMIGGLAIDRDAHEVSVDGDIKALTPTEFKILDMLASNIGCVFTRDHLMDKISVDGGEIFDRTLDRHVANLRRKIEPQPSRPKYIVTVLGTGYKLMEQK